jgi:hypothetical protein
MMGETLWLFSFKTKMTYLKEWSILKMRVFGEATRCKVKEKVKVERALTTIAQLMTG